VTLRAGSANGQPAFATYEPEEAAEPGGATRLVVTGLQIVQLTDVNGELLISALVSYRDPEVAVRCGLPAVIDLPPGRD
jgi:hypothetical protein